MRLISHPSPLAASYALALALIATLATGCSGINASKSFPLTSSCRVSCKTLQGRRCSRSKPTLFLGWPKLALFCCGSNNSQTPKHETNSLPGTFARAGPQRRGLQVGPQGGLDAEKKADLRKQRGKLLAPLRPLVAGLLALVAVSLVGCQSAKQPGIMSHASVQVKGHSLEDIRQTTTAVFREAGYSLVATSPVEMVFDRPGSRRDAAKWGGWSGEGVTMRVKAGVSKMTDGSFLLEADAYAVQNSDDEFFRNREPQYPAEPAPLPATPG